MQNTSVKLTSRLAVCSWSLQPANPQDLVAKLKDVGLHRIQLALDPLRESAYRDLMQYATFPMPERYPDYPHHTQIAKYFDDYVDHFGFRENIRFNTEVTRVEPAPGD